MSNENPQGQRVAILATDGFEQVELTSPRDAMSEAGIVVHVIAPKSGQIKGWDKTGWGDSVDVDFTLDQVDETDYDALVLPGGVLNPDQLRMNDKALEFIRSFFASGKPVGAICHGPQLLISAEVVDGRRVTSYSSIRKDLENAGAKWQDDEVVCDAGLTTSRTPDDLDAFNSKVIEEVGEGRHKKQHA